MNTDLTAEQIEALEAMIDRRMDNTSDTREEARAHILTRFKERFE